MKNHQLTDALVEELATRDTVRRVAVENFLSTLDGLSKDEALKNLSLDTRLYKWNSETVRAIRDGIRVAFKK